MLRESVATAAVREAPPPRPGAAAPRRREAAPATMGRKSRRPSLVSPTTQRELQSLTGSMRAQTARHLAEEQCAVEQTRRRPRTPSPRRPKRSVFTRLAGDTGEAAGEDAVAAYLKRCNHVRVVGKCVVRRSVAFESPQVATLDNDQLVCVEEERLLGDERRVRLSAPCVGWVSRKCLSVTEDLLNERRLRTLVCVSGEELPLFEAWLRFYRRHHNASRELHVGFYDDEAYTYLLKLQDDDRLNVTLHDTVTFTNVYERKEAQNRGEKMRIFQWVCQSAPPGSPVVYSCVLSARRRGDVGSSPVDFHTGLFLSRSFLDPRPAAEPPGAP